MTQRQIAFVNEYLRTGNATEAAIKAGYSPATAYSIGSENLRKPEIQKAIQTFRENMEKKTEVTIERVVQELMKVAFSDIGEVLEVEGDQLRIKNLSELSSDVRAAISEITTTDTKFGEKRTLKLHSKLTALDMLMKHLGGYVTVADLIDRMDEAELEKISQKLIAKVNEIKS